MSKPVSLRQTSICVVAADIFLPVVTAFVEHSSLAFGLGKPEALKMMLASEELFLHLCRVVIPKQGMIEVRCSCKGHIVQSDFSFPETRINMHAFNLTALPRSSGTDDLDDMRMILASRSVDHLNIRRKENQRIISLIKEKKYPKAVAKLENPHPITCRDFAIQSPLPDELKYFALLTARFYDQDDIPVFFQYPGMLVDMIDSGGYHAITARGPAGEIGGGLVWRLLTDNTVEVFGPFVMVDDDRSRTVCVSLIEACISRAGRTSAVVMICYPPESGQYTEYFEFLGRMNCYAITGALRQRSLWFRLMHEDMGSAVWTTPEMDDFLQHAYRRLFLAREIRHVADQGESRNAYSVFSTQIDRLRRQVTLDILWPGEDIEDNLMRHLDLFQKEGIRNIIFEIDAGIAWKSEIMPCLLKNGFQPILILPYAGTGDIIVFQLLHHPS